jgi:hypothetical protein
VDVNMPTFHGRTTLSFASEYGRSDIVQYLIEYCRADRYWEDHVSFHLSSIFDDFEARAYFSAAFLR